MDRRQQIIIQYLLSIQGKVAERTGKLESVDRLNLEPENAGLSGAAAGVGSDSDAGRQSQESVSEKKNCRKNN